MDMGESLEPKLPDSVRAPQTTANTADISRIIGPAPRRSMALEMGPFRRVIVRQTEAV
jgi:hypothetical protein